MKGPEPLAGIGVGGDHPDPEEQEPMAEFGVGELEGMRVVQIKLRDETVRAEAGALSYMQGDIRITARLPSIGSAINR
jgi:uncharacterized protein (AIM24 family)